MPSVLANEDQPMGDASEAGANVAADALERFIDLNEQRIRVVGSSRNNRKVSLAQACCTSYLVQVIQRLPSNSRQRVTHWEML